MDCCVQTEYSGALCSPRQTAPCYRSSHSRVEVVHAHFVLPTAFESLILLFIVNRSFCCKGDAECFPNFCLPQVMMMILPLLIFVLLPKVVNTSDPDMRRVRGHCLPVGL